MKALIPIERVGRRSQAGNKALNLSFLARKGFRIPETFLLRLERSQRLTSPEFREEIRHLLDVHGALAVRSSANVEDTSQNSFAGQFKSFLDLKTEAQVVEAIEEVMNWDSSEQLRSYAERSSVEREAIVMNVIVQEMVSPVYSGVVFTCNPLTGLNETIVEAVSGRGDALVQDGVTPERWVDKWGTWIEKPDSADVSEALMKKIVAEAKAIARVYGRVIDLEWVYDGTDIYWLQLREITALNYPDVYSNHIPKEFLPGIIKPLVWSINIPLVNGAWVRLFTEMIGKNDIDPLRLARSFYYRAYFNMGVIGSIFKELGMPAETLELLIGIEVEGPDKPKFKPTSKTFRKLPRLTVFFIDKLLFGRRARKKIPQFREQSKSYDIDTLATMEPSKIIDRIDSLYGLNSEIAYYNIVIPLLMSLYNRLMTSSLKKIGIAAENLNIVEGISEMKRLDPNYELKRLRAVYSELSAGARTLIEAEGYSGLLKSLNVAGFRDELDRFLADFGHLSASGNDFSFTPWREDLDHVLSMIVNFEDIGQKSLITLDEALEGRKTGLWRKFLYNKAREFRVYREEISSIYTYSYGLFRDHFLALARTLVEQDRIDMEDDIFYLSLSEIRAMLNGVPNGEEPRETVKKRRLEIETYRNIAVPSIIFGDDVPPAEEKESSVLKGTPTSRGYYRGKVRLVHDTSDFNRIERGDVLVIPYSDVAWTPLFAKAGAVISESGGVLSHSSIIAREYGIPAVVSVRGALSILREGELVLVDGYTGKITVENGVS